MKLNQRYNLEVIRVYAPTRRSEEDSVEQPCVVITTAKRNENAKYIVVIGDFIASLEQRLDDSISNIGRFRLDNSNERGQNLTDYWRNENLFCMNTSFKSR